ncbi:NYN domain-containing protein [Acidovorax sp. SUPP2522]|uniref:NYN domain-containing protein n=1 Tax=unclassified Acidovorax TaxID=2684926 RepID=UPI00234A0153|nr:MULTISPECIES: NYN domain-containing protein [unclassified Acidovorax]WCM99652.1 NYN domain-containing protein [Acidovorax sp. GBBC 1281]GKT19041.1 NYN domain-containing protein [Acidovorax sp. SUPP2522]
MSTISTPAETRVAVLVDCDNVPPDILEHALRMVAQFGRVVLRRGYGNQGTLAHKWQDALVRLAFTPCLQYQYAAGKNTADIALALDALEALFDKRADTFCLVTSDSDFAYLCRKLRERGATVCIVGEPKTPDALRNASDQFFEWVRPEPTVEALGETIPKATAKTEPVKAEPPKLESSKPAVKRRPRFLIDAVSLLASDTSEGKVGLGALGQYLKRTDPAFSPQTYGHSGLLNMVKTYDLLAARQEEGGHWSVSLVPKAEATGEADGDPPGA